MSIKTMKERFAPVWWDNFKGLIDDNFAYLMSLGQNLIDTKAEAVSVMRLASATDKVIVDTFPEDIADATLDTLYTTSEYWYVNFPLGISGTIEIDGGEYQLNNGDWLTTSSTLVTTDVIKFRATSSAVNETAVEVSVTVTIDDVPTVYIWTITTVAA